MTQEDITGDQFVCRRVDEIPGYKRAGRVVHRLLDELRDIDFP